MFEYLLIPSIVAVVLLLIVIIITFAVAGDTIFVLLAAKLKKAPILLIVRKDGRAGLITGTMQGGSLDTKYGMFLLHPDAMKPFYGTMLGIVYEKVGTVASPAFIQAATNLKKKGIKDYHQAKAVKDDLIQGIEEGVVEKTEEVSDILKNIDQIVDYFVYNMNPSNLSEKVSNAVHFRIGKKDSDAMKWLIIAGFAVLLVLLGFYVVIGRLQCPDYGAMVENAYATCQAVFNSSRVISPRSII